MRNSLDFKNIFKRETKLASYIVICLTIVVISLSYAMFFQVDQNSKNQEVVAGDFTFTYTDGSTITSSGNTACFEPMSLDDSSLFLESCGYRFSVSNAGSLKASYTLKLLKNDESTMEENKIKILLRKKVGDVYEVVENYPKSVNDLTEGILVSEEINAKTTIEYNIQLYIDESAHIDSDTSKPVSYQIEGTGVVHEEQPIHTEDTKNMMVAMELSSVCEGFTEEEMDNIGSWYNKTYTQGTKYLNKINHISFEDSMNPYENASEVVDFSAAQDRSVLGYYVSVEGTEKYDLHIQADGKIKPNTISKFTFSKVTASDNCSVGYHNYEETNLMDSFTLLINKSSQIKATLLAKIEGDLDDDLYFGFENIDTSKVKSMNFMFYANPNKMLDLSSFDTSNVIDMSWMFYNCRSLTSLNLSHFNTSKVTNMVGMFHGCGGLTNLDLKSFDTSNVTNMNGMFAFCASLTNLDLNTFNSINVTSMSNMFSNCSSLTSLDLSLLDTTHVTDMSGMFYDCSSLISLDISSFDTTNVTDMSHMFSGCRSLSSLDLSSFNTIFVKDFSHMFQYDEGLQVIYGDNFIHSEGASVYYMLYCGDDPSYDMPVPPHESWKGLDLGNV